MDGVASCNCLASIGRRAGDASVLARVGTKRDGEVAIIGGACVAIVTLGLVGDVRAVVVRAVAHEGIDGARVPVVAADRLVHTLSRGGVARGGCAGISAGQQDVHAASVQGVAGVEGARVLVIAVDRVRDTHTRAVLDGASGGGACVDGGAVEEVVAAVVRSTDNKARVVGAWVVVIAGNCTD